MTKKRRRSIQRVEPQPQPKTQNQPMLIAGVTVVAVVLVALLILLGSQPDKDESPTAHVEVEGVEIGITEDGFPYQGSPDAPVKFIEFSDYTCGHCRDFALEKEPKIVAEYVSAGKVQYIYHYYALQQTLLSEAACCAADQGRFWEYHRLMFRDQSRFGSIETLEDLQALLVDFAEQSGLDVPAFEECWSSHKHQETIIEAIETAQAMGVGGTPAFSVQGELIVGNQPYDVFQTAIEDALAQAGQ